MLPALGSLTPAGAGQAQHLTRGWLGPVSSTEAFRKPGGLVRARLLPAKADEELGVGGSRTEPSAKV